MNIAKENDNRHDKNNCKQQCNNTPTSKQNVNHKIHWQRQQSTTGTLVCVTKTTDATECID